MSDADIALAIRVDDVSLLELNFAARGPLPALGRSAMLMDNPEHELIVDEEADRLALKAVVTVQFTLADEKAAMDNSGEETLLFAAALGVVTSVAGQSSENIERALRAEAIKAAHAFASTKLAEMTALSPMGKVLLPAIDADELLRDLGGE